MDLTMVVSRIIHLFSAVLWVGTTWSMGLFIGPTAQAVGTDAQKFMQHFLLRSRFARLLTLAGMLTVASGLVMYYRLFGGLANLSTGTGLALTVGALAGIAALGVGLRMGRLINRMRTIGGEIAKAGGAPKPEQQAEVGKLQEALSKSGATNAILMVVALLGMTLSEYFAF